MAVDGMAAITVGYDDLVRQHRAVRIEMSELRGMIDSCRATQRTDGFRRMLAVLVRRLRERLALHFEIERDGVYLGALIGPEGAALRDRFQREHDALLAEGGRLAALLRAPNAPPDAVGKTMLWLESLRLHEQAEEGFLAGLNGGE